MTEDNGKSRPVGDLARPPPGAPKGADAPSHPSSMQQFRAGAGEGAKQALSVLGGRWHWVRSHASQSLVAGGRREAVKATLVEGSGEFSLQKWHLSLYLKVGVSYTGGKVGREQQVPRS